jgi:hypothetical protein
MNKNSIAIFFTLIIMAMCSAPSIIAAIDDSIDISIILSLNEQEEKEGNEIKDIQVLVSEISNFNSEIESSENRNNSGYYFNDYSNPQLNLISPPPQSNIS